jgi:hypothetical protein
MLIGNWICVRYKHAQSAEDLVWYVLMSGGQQPLLRHCVEITISQRMRTVMHEDNELLLQQNALLCDDRSVLFYALIGQITTCLCRDIMMLFDYFSGILRTYLQTT